MGQTNKPQWFHNKTKFWITAGAATVGSGILLYSLASKYTHPKTISSLSSLITTSSSGNYSISPLFDLSKNYLFQKYGCTAFSASSSVLASRSRSRSRSRSTYSFSTTSKPTYLHSYLTTTSHIPKSLLLATSIRSYATRTFDPFISSNFASIKPRLYHVSRGNGGGGSSGGHDSGGSGGEGPKFTKSQINAGIVLIVGGICVYNIETVPYSKRKHVVLVPRFMERNMGEKAFAQHRVEKSWKILPSNHPQTKKLSSIVNSVTRVADKHVDGMNWKLFVVDKPDVVNACCYPGGIVVVFTGLLNKFKSMDELATVIGHEIGHAVARHGAENYFKMNFLSIFRRSLADTPTDDVVMKAILLILVMFAEICVHLSRSRKFEKEADYVGLLLMASAGYDPRIAPKVYEILGELGSPVPEFFSTHPEGSKRAKLLSKSEVMQEALSVYEGAVLGYK